MIFGRYGCPEAEGVILAHSLRLKDRMIKKGKALTVDDLTDIQKDGIEYVTGARLGADDVAEDQAAVIVATALAGDDLIVGKPVGGRCNLYAKQEGIVVIDKARIDAINLTNSGIAVATLPDYGEAVAQQAVASIKVIPFAVPRQLVELCAMLAMGEGAEGKVPAVSLKAYRPKRVVLIQTEAPGLKVSVLDSTREVIQQRLEKMGSRVISEHRCAHSIDAVSSALKLALADGCDLVLISAATVTVDIGDTVPSAIVREGGIIDHFGMPVEPGNMLLLARHGSRIIINLPGCARSPKLNGLDWVLQRIHADIPVNQHNIQLMGVGGLIKDVPHVSQVNKQQNMKKSSRVPDSLKKSPRVAAVILAAGRSTRMGKQNKLLVNIGKGAMVAQVASAALASNAQQVVVVTGHEADQVQSVLAGLEVNAIYNPDYETGMASSLCCGLDAVHHEMDGAIILLGDMPLISADQINDLIAAFNPNMERDIVAPFVDGKRGNPVLWARRYFPVMKLLTGDTGARNLLKERRANVLDVPARNNHIFTDFDTPESLADITNTAIDQVDTETEHR